MLAWILAGRPSLAFSWAWPETLFLSGAVPGLATFAHGLMALIHCPSFSARSAIKIRKESPSSVVCHTELRRVCWRLIEVSYAAMGSVSRAA